MSGRGASRRAPLRLVEPSDVQELGRKKPACESEFSFVTVGVIGRSVVTTAKQLLEGGLDHAEVCSLFAQTAAVLSKQPGGLTRAQFLALCEEHYDRDELEHEAPVTAPGGLS